MITNRDPQRTVALSIICVYNNELVRANCLDASIHILRSKGANIEYIQVDNRNHEFNSAGSALNYGVQQAHNTVVVLVHQDVILHSWNHLLHGAALLQDSMVGIVGAIGVDSNGVTYGRICDRVSLTGNRCGGRGVEVDSVDELLLMARRTDILRTGLAEIPSLAWHGYGVEYCARVRRNGGAAIATDLMVTHNSETTNLLGLTESHQWICRSYPEQLPLNTTCGTLNIELTQPIRSYMRRIFRAVSARLEDLIRVRTIRKLCHGAMVITSDIRVDIDVLLALLPARHINIECVVDSEDSFGPIPSPFQLQRRGGSITFRTWDSNTFDILQDGLSRSEAALVTGLSENILAELPDDLLDLISLAGVHRDGGLWILVGSDSQRIAHEICSMRSPVYRALVRLGARHVPR